MYVNGGQVLVVCMRGKILAGFCSRSSEGQRENVWEADGLSAGRRVSGIFWSRSRDALIKHNTIVSGSQEAQEKHSRIVLLSHWLLPGLDSIIWHWLHDDISSYQLRCTDWRCVAGVWPRSPTMCRSGGHTAGTLLEDGDALRDDDRTTTHFLLCFCGNFYTTVCISPKSMLLMLTWHSFNVFEMTSSISYLHIRLMRLSECRFLWGTGVQQCVPVCTRRTSQLPPTSAHWSVWVSRYVSRNFRRFDGDFMKVFE